MRQDYPWRIFFLIVDELSKSNDHTIDSECDFFLIFVVLRESDFVEEL